MVECQKDLSVHVRDLAQEQADFCSLFSNPIRILILWALFEKELSVGGVAEVVGTTIQNVSQHLNKMKNFGIISSRREGQTIYYRITGVELLNGCPLLEMGQRLGIVLTEPLNSLDPITQQQRSPIMTTETIDLVNIEAAKVVDARGSACPGPLLEAKKGIGTISVGQVLEIWSGDPNTRVDLQRWATKVGHEYLGVLTAEGYDRLFLRRLK